MPYVSPATGYTCAGCGDEFVDDPYTIVHPSAWDEPGTYLCLMCTRQSPFAAD